LTKLNLTKGDIIMKVFNGTKKGMLLHLTLLAFFLTVDQGVAYSEDSLRANPTIYTPGITLLTPGSSTTLENTPGETGIFATVITLGVGTLKVTLKKTDTAGDLISMFVIGFPADPSFIPSFGVTPGEISVSTALNDALGGFRIIFIVTVVNSRDSYQSTLSLALD
jgi:hypothetical protein